MNMPDLPVVEESKTKALEISGEYNIQSTNETVEYYEVPILIPIPDDEII